MFTRAFLNTAISLPKQDKILKYILIFILIDTIIYPVSIIFEFGLYLVILIYVVYLGYRRMKQRYKPAFFFFIGWSIFVLTILIDGFVDFELHIEPYAFNPMFLGTMIEAIVLAIALAFQFKELRIEQEQQKQLLIHQSKLASMGEMLGNIAHQWRQPLTRLSYTLMNIEVTEDIKEKKGLVEESTKQLEFMSQTINDFTNFYAPSKEKELFSLEHVAKEVIELVHYEEIEVQLEINNDTHISNYKNEFKQVLLNLLSNAKDVLELRKITHPCITMIVDKNTVSVKDNAGGIVLEDIEKIFEPYYSTKENGLGIGLYMSKIIIEKNMGGKLIASNIAEGAVFTLSF
jgi:signal transduction histidine kinase